MVFGLSGTLPVSAVCCFTISVFEKRSTIALHSAPALQNQSPQTTSNSFCCRGTCHWQRRALLCDGLGGWIFVAISPGAAAPRGAGGQIECSEWGGRVRMRAAVDLRKELTCCSWITDWEKRKETFCSTRSTLPKIYVFVCAGQE
jgi:hypothetical protein